MKPMLPQITDDTAAKLGDGMGLQVGIDARVLDHHA